MMPNCCSDDLIESTYSIGINEDNKLDEHEDKANQYPAKIKSLVSVDCNKLDETVSYKNKEVECDDQQEAWRSVHMNVQEGPLQPGGPSYKKSSFNEMVDWKYSSTIHKTLPTIAADAPGMDGKP